MTLLLLNLAGTVALLLWGVHMVQSGIQRALGAKLRRLLGKALGNRLQALLGGLSVTAILQSSTATALMITGFAATGLVGLVPALAVMLGANIGSTLIVQALSFNVIIVAPILVLIGVVLFRRAKASARDSGRVFIGLGLILMALGQFVSLLGSPEISHALGSVASELRGQPLIAALIAAALTWAMHSSVASVLLVMSLASQGLVPADVAIALVLGANIGTAINPILEGSASSDPASRRLPLGSLAIRFIGVAAALAALPWLMPLIVSTSGDIARAIANFHTLFNATLALIFLPLLGLYARLLLLWLPDRIDEGDPAKVRYLDRAARDTPVIALGAAAREALRLADLVASMLQRLKEILETNDRRLIDQTSRLDDVVDRLNSEIKSYITSLDPEALSKADHKRVSEILAFSTNMEQAADIVDNNLLVLAEKKIKRGLVFSKEGEAELMGMIDRLIDNTQAAASLLVTDDVRAARLMARQKEMFRQLEGEAVTAHFERLKSGRKDTAESSALHLDALRDLKQVNSHLVAAAAYPVLKGHGELLESRVVPVES
jgi:phosphate:Na+ symporter